MRIPLRRLGLSMAALGIGLSTGLLLCELGLRASDLWIGRHSDTMFLILQHDRTLGWKMIPHLETNVDLVDVEGIAVRSNSAGFWDHEFPRHKPGDRFRIAFIGDSFTWGMGVQEHERFSNLLAEDPAFESLNFGIPGYGTDQELLLYRDLVRRYLPDLVILTVYQNDYRDNMYSVRYGRAKPYFELDPSGRLRLSNFPVPGQTFWSHGILNQVPPAYAPLFEQPIERRSRAAHWLAKNSDLVRFLYTFMLGRSQRLHGGGGGESSSRPSLEAPDTRTLAQVHLLGRLIGELSEEVRATETQLWIALAGEYVMHHQLLRERLEQRGIRTLDVTTSALERELDRGSIYFPLNGHWTAEAHRAVARFMAHSLRKQVPVLPRRRESTS